MKKNKRERIGIDNRLELLAAFFLLIVAIPALIYGWNFMKDPTGEGLGFNTELLASTPFDDFFLPGVVLFVAIGVLNIVAISSILFYLKNAGWHTIFQGLMLIGWLSVQLLYGIRAENIQSPFYVFGALLVVTGILMNVKERRFGSNR